jgi:hypothetical protein
MGTIYLRRRTRMRPGEPKCPDKQHGQTTTCPTCKARFGPTWWIAYYKQGRGYYESSGSPVKSDAVALLKQREGDIVSGRFVGVRGDRLTFEDLAKLLTDDY